MYKSHIKRKPVLEFPTRSDTNRAEKQLEMARGLKLQDKKIEGFYFLCSENKEADQLHVNFPSISEKVSIKEN